MRRIVMLVAAVSLFTGSCTPASLPGISDIAGETDNNNSNNADDADDADSDNGDSDSDDGNSDDGDSDDGNNNQQEESMTIRISVGGKEFRADIDDTETGRAFLAKLPLELDMSELNGNEKYCYGITLPRADRYCETIAAGDLMLYSGNCVVLFYGPAGGYSYTRIGRLQSVEGLAAALGRGSVSVTFAREQ